MTSEMVIFAQVFLVRYFLAVLMFSRFSMVALHLTFNVFLEAKC